MIVSLGFQMSSFLMSRRTHCAWDRRGEMLQKVREALQKPKMSADYGAKKQCRLWSGETFTSNHSLLNNGGSARIYLTDEDPYD